MNFRKHDKETLDRIGKGLFARAAMPADEIDRIVADPHLFAKVRARSRRTVPARLPVIKYAATFAAVALLAIVGVAAITISWLKQDLTSERTMVQAPADVPVTARPANLPPLKVGSNPSPGRATLREAEREQVAPKRAVYVAPKTSRGLEHREASPEFYPVAYTGDPSEIGGGSHIIRVDMPRSSLFALGVNVPLENDSETIKADVIVGGDGVARAIRVLK